MNHRGFTLVEMLVAIGLMALMAIICWRGLVYVADQRATVAREAGEIAHLVRTFAQMERDLAERVPNGALPAPPAATELPLAVGVSLIDRGAIALEVARFVPQPGAAPQAVRVLYRLSGDGLSRSTRGLDDARGTGSNEVVLLPGAKTFHVRVHAGGFWVEPGHEGGVQPTAPATALEVAVEDRDGSRYTKVFAL
jgi:general secretion pathway protein J